MELTEELKALGAALKILRRARLELMEGPDAVWNVVAHASKYLEEQATGLLKELQSFPPAEAEAEAFGEPRPYTTDAPYPAAP